MSRGQRPLILRKKNLYLPRFYFSSALRAEFSPACQSRQAKKERGFRGKEFLPACCPAKRDCGFLPAAAGGGQIIGSDSVSLTDELN